MTDIVECLSGFTFADRPTALTWKGQRFPIVEILSQGRTPRAKWFRVRTEDGQLFELSHVETANESPSDSVWQIHQF
ncbi:MAG TPA: hypothetical protein VF359_06620 [Anaerolineales bacterium]